MKNTRTKPLSYEEVFNYFKDNGCELLETEYVNNHTHMKYRCSCGNISKITLIGFKNGRRCRKCLKERNKNKEKHLKHSYNFVKGFFEFRRCTLLSKIYKGDREKLEFICRCGNKDKISFGTFKRGFLCKRCSGEYIAQNKPYCIDFIRYYLLTRGMVLLSDEYIDSYSPIEFICCCGNYNKTNYGNITVGYKCKKCTIETRSKENCHFWIDGLTPLSAYIRNNVLLDWKKESMRACNYECILTGGSFNDIHHLYSLNKIIRWALSQLNLPVKDINNAVNSYTEEELKTIEEKVLELHKKYGLGVCLKKELHMLFHNIYGTDYNTEEQFEELKLRLKLGEFDNFLKENNLKIII